jgi:hypothetical protein
MRLISPEVARVVLNEPEGDDVTRMFTTATELAIAPLEDVIKTPFERATITDVFHVQPGRTPAVTQFPSTLKLSRGFLDLEISVAFKTETITNGEFQAAENYVGDYVVNHIAGTVTVPARLVGWYSVTYTAGFEVDESCAGTVTTVIPDWLQSANLTLVQSIYQKLNARHAVSGLDEKSQKLSQAGLTQFPAGLANGLQRHVRWFPTAYNVEWSA